jgi:hypothetical protein
MRTILALSVAVAALSVAACNKPAAPKAEAPPAAGKAGAALKMRKAGVWEINTEMPNMPVALGPMRRCFGAEEVGGEMFRRPGRGGRGPECMPRIEPQPDGSIKIAGSCDLPNGGHSETTGVVTGDFATHYAVTMTNTISDTGTPMDGAHTIKMDAKYLGACPAGVEAGAMLDANNQPMSREDMVARFQAQRKARRDARQDGPASEDNN